MAIVQTTCRASILADSDTSSMRDSVIVQLAKPPFEYTYKQVNQALGRYNRSSIVEMIQTLKKEGLVEELPQPATTQKGHHAKVFVLTDGGAAIAVEFYDADMKPLYKYMESHNRNTTALRILTNAKRLKHYATIREAAIKASQGDSRNLFAAIQSWSQDIAEEFERELKQNPRLSPSDLMAKKTKEFMDSLLGDVS